MTYQIPTLPLPFDIETKAVMKKTALSRMQVPQGRHFINRRCNLRTANHNHSSKSRRDDTCILTYKSTIS